MMRVEIKEVTRTNWAEASRLAVAPDQQDFVPTVMESVAEAYIRPHEKEMVTPYAIYAEGQMVGFGRAISDGQSQSAIYDVVVLPEFQGRGVGKAVMQALLAKLPQGGAVLIYAAPGMQDFYRKFGFGLLKTGMALFPDPERYRSKGYLE